MADPMSTDIDHIIGDHRTLVIEGCDGVGKTTLAQQLAVRHGFSVVHSPRTPDHLNLASRYREILSGPGRILFDRCFLSELVYGPLNRGCSRITWSEAIDLAETVVARDGLLVHLTAPPTVIHQRLLTRDGEAISLNEVAELVTGYSRVFTTLGDYVPVQTFDVTAFDLPSAG
jgi:thymidylate kinase